MKKSTKINILILILALLAILGTGTVVYAKYRTSRSQSAATTSSSFHFSSNLLTESGATWTISDWGNGFDIELYNYETENLANVSDADITYTVTVSDGWVYSVNNTTSTNYTLKKSTGRGSQVLRLTPDATVSGGSMTVTVKTTSPYVKTISATFTLVGEKTPEYTISDQGDGSVLVTIQTNNYSGTVTLKWNPAKFTPDNTNELTRTFYNSNVGADGLSYGTIALEGNSTYRILFLTTETVTAVTGTGTTITLQ